MTQITTIGEILVDLTQTNVDEQGLAHFCANPGGAPANAAVAAARLGAGVAFIGKVGQDHFGAMLRKTLADNGVDVSALAVQADVPTTLAVVTVDETGERSFSFYRNPGADLCLRESDLPAALLSSTRFLHFGSVSLTADPARAATLAAVRAARAAGAIITYDPNYRANLWPDETTAVQWMRAPLGLVDVLKISDEELPLLTGTTDPAEGARALQAHGIRLVLITLGANGVYYRHGEDCGTVPGFGVKVADTNGAGDTFFGAFLSRLALRQAGLDELAQTELETYLRFANKAASLTTSRHGAIPAMPTLAEVESSLAE